MTIFPNICILQIFELQVNATFFWHVISSFFRNKRLFKDRQQGSTGKLKYLCNSLMITLHQCQNIFSRYSKNSLQQMDKLRFLFNLSKNSLLMELFWNIVLCWWNFVHEVHQILGGHIFLSFQKFSFDRNLDNML